MRRRYSAHLVTLQSIVLTQLLVGVHVAPSLRLNTSRQDVWGVHMLQEQPFGPQYTLHREYMGVAVLNNGRTGGKDRRHGSLTSLPCC